MKQKVIYIERFSYEDRSNIFRGFHPCKDDKGNDVVERIVEIEPSNWGYNDNGSCLIVRVYEKSRNPKEGMQSKLLEERWIYDNNPSNSNNILPSANQERIISALVSNDLRGSSAEEFVKYLFHDMLILNPKSFVRKYLDFYVEWFDNHYAEYNVKIESK